MVVVTLCRGKFGRLHQPLALCLPVDIISFGTKIIADGMTLRSIQTPSDCSATLCSGRMCESEVGGHAVDLLDLGLALKVLASNELGNVVLVTILALITLLHALVALGQLAQGG